MYNLLCSGRGAAVQDVPPSPPDAEPHRPDVAESGEAQAAAHPDHVHERSAQRARESVRRDALPGHLHARGDRHEDRPHRGQSAGAPTDFRLHQFSPFSLNTDCVFVFSFFLF